MQRQVLPTLDLRSQAERQGITRTQQTVQAMAGILQTMGKAEKVRRDRQTLDRIVRSIASGKTNIEAIAEATRQEPEFGTGFQGGLQRLGGMFSPQGGGIRESIEMAIIGQKLKEALAPKIEKRQARADLRYTKARTKALKAPRPTTLSPIMKMVNEGLITQAEGRKLARKDADNDLGEKDIISIMHTIERALEATYDSIGSPLPGREDQRMYYVEQLEQYKTRLDDYRSARRGETESYYSPSNPPLENLPLGTLEVNRTAPIAPRPYLNSYWGNLDDNTKSLVTRAITQGSTQTEILAALRDRGAIK